MEKVSSLAAEKSMEYASCNLCGADRTRLLFASKDMLFNKAGNFRIVKCRNCGLVYLNPRPGEELMQQYYPAQYYSYKPPRNDKKAAVEEFFLRLNERLKNQILREYFNYGSRPGSLPKRFLSLLKKIALFPLYLRLTLVGRDIKIIPYQGQGKILDIGCGSGRTLSLLKKRGWNVYGIEANSQAVDIARNKLGLQVYLGNISNVDFQNDFFDVVTMTHTLEHMANPKQILRKVNKILKTSGTLIITVPDSDSLEARYFKQFWLGWDPPRHLYSFSLKTLKKMLQAVGGFRIKRIRYEMGTAVLRESLTYKLRDERNYNLQNSRLLEFILRPISMLLGYLRKSSIIILYVTKTDNVVEQGAS